MSDDIARAVGRLEGKVDALSADVGDIKQKVDLLTEARWKRAGRTSIISALVSALVAAAAAHK